jgi:hypothetical protein
LGFIDVTLSHAGSGPARVPARLATSERPSEKPAAKG